MGILYGSPDLPYDLQRLIGIFLPIKLVYQRAAMLQQILFPWFFFF